MNVEFRRLGPDDVDEAVDLFRTLARVFGEGGPQVSPAHARRTLSSNAFVSIAAVADGSVIGGLTAHILPMTRDETCELFIYDIAVVPECQRRGVGSGLIQKAREVALQDGIRVAFVMADGDDDDAIEFYRSTPATDARVVVFTFDEA